MGRSAIPNGLFLDDFFNQGDDRVGALLLVGESCDPAVGGYVNVFVGARGVERAAQIGLFTLVELDKHAQDGGQAITGAGKHTDDAQTADFLCPIAPVAVGRIARDVD